MGRDIITKQDVRDARLRRAAAGSVAGGTEPIPVPDEYGDRLIKYIPSEVIALYLTVAGMISVAPEGIPKDSLAWFSAGFLWLMTPVYLWRIQNVKKISTLLIAFVSFLIWVFTLGGPFTQLSWYSPFYGTLILPIYTFSVAVYQGKKVADPN